MFWKLSLFLTLTPFSALFSQIKEIRNFQEITPHLNRDQLIVLDIDNTLLEPMQELGNDQWFRHRIAAYQKQGMDSRNALERALPEWVAIQNITKVRAVEESTPDRIKKMQNEGYAIMALTTRGLGMATRTIEQLHTIGIDTTITSPSSEEKFFMNEQGVLFRKGILFTAGSHKGRALKKLLQTINYKPKGVLYVNDKRSHLQEVEEQCEEDGIPFQGLRYGFLDEKVGHFRADLAEIQFDHFGHILSDDAAEAILESAKIRSELLKEREKIPHRLAP